MQSLRFISYSPAVLVLATLFLSACGDNQPVTYAGEVVPQAGVCEAAAHGVLIKQGHFVRFTPHEGVLILNGEISPDGAIAAKTTAPGADHKPYAITFQGRLSGEAITGAYVSPHCRAAVTLKRAS